MVKKLFTAVAMVSVASIASAGQAPVKTTASPTSSKPYTPPKTPWGDPDLQGNYTNKYEQGTPFERPDELAGKKQADIQPAELAEIVKRRQQARARERDPFLSGDPTGTDRRDRCSSVTSSRSPGRAAHGS